MTTQTDRRADPAIRAQMLEILASEVAAYHRALGDFNAHASMILTDAYTQACEEIPIEASDAT